MYKIHVWDDETCSFFWEYGFGRYLMKRVCYYHNETCSDGYYSRYDVVHVYKIVFTWKTFKKCLTHHKEYDKMNISNERKE